MKQHFVTFFSPGTFVSEQRTCPIEKWDVNEAKRLAKSVKERHGATPYGFQFSTRLRGRRELDSKIVKSSGMYYLGGKIETIEEVFIRQDPKENILRSNMKANGIGKVITNTNSWKITLPFNNDDVLLEWE